MERVLEGDHELTFSLACGFSFAHTAIHSSVFQTLSHPPLSRPRFHLVPRYYLYMLGVYVNCGGL